jgi:hypothetical protein
LKIVVIDSGPFGLATHPRARGDAGLCQQWIADHLSAGSRLMVPEIADYEVRRELIRAHRTRGPQNLDAIGSWAEYLALTTAIMRRAAEFWAEIRSQGLPTADDTRLDADVILAAQAESIEQTGVVIATTNVGHLARFCDAAPWFDILPD